MGDYLTAVKDVLIILSPIVIAYISYRSNKKTKEDIRLEVERITKEKEAETRQILDKISAELESQKQLLSWQNSLPQTNKYTDLLDTKRFGHVSALPKLCQDIYVLLQSCPSVAALEELNQMLDRIELPKDDEALFPHEIPIILSFKVARDAVDRYIQTATEQQMEKNKANG